MQLVGIIVGAAVRLRWLRRERTGLEKAEGLSRKRLGRPAPDRSGNGDVATADYFIADRIQNKVSARYALCIFVIPIGADSRLRGRFAL